MILIVIPVPKKFLTDVYSKDHWYLIRDANFLLWADDVAKHGYVSMTDYDRHLVALSEVCGQDHGTLKKIRGPRRIINTRADVPVIAEECKAMLQSLHQLETK